MSSKPLLRQKKKIILGIIFIFLIIAVISLFWGTLDKRTDAVYCTSCHMMKPELYTWQASTHSQVVECVGCHAPPGVLKKVEYRLFTVKEWYAALTGNYGIMITPTEAIPDSVCNQCHDMNTRQVTPSGDLIIPHTKHAQKGVRCTECHPGIAHGNIAEKNVTFRTDYARWDESVGKRFMSDPKNTRPNMDTCINCHKVRKAPLSCSTCHKTSMLPDSHKTETFQNGGHGDEAAKNIEYCDSCHSYMSTEKVEVTKGNESKYQQFLAQNSGRPTLISVTDYAKSNTYCKDCHGKMPPSHKVNMFEVNHGQLAEKNKDLCFVCHDNRVMGDSPVTNLACGTCHPSIHSKTPWKERHPVPLPDKPQVTEMCYSCHSERTCSRCHNLSE